MLIVAYKHNQNTTKAKSNRHSDQHHVARIKFHGLLQQKHGVLHAHLSGRCHCGEVVTVHVAQQEKLVCQS